MKPDLLLTNVTIATYPLTTYQCVSHQAQWGYIGTIGQLGTYLLGQRALLRGNVRLTFVGLDNCRWLLILSQKQAGIGCFLSSKSLLLAKNGGWTRMEIEDENYGKTIKSMLLPIFKGYGIFWLCMNQAHRLPKPHSLNASLILSQEIFLLLCCPD